MTPKKPLLIKAGGTAFDYDEQRWTYTVFVGTQEICLNKFFDTEAKADFAMQHKVMELVCSYKRRTNALNRQNHMEA